MKAPESKLCIMTIPAVLVYPANQPNYPTNLVPEYYHDLLLLFGKKGADKLPPHRYVDHEINLEADRKPPKGRMYSISATEQYEVRT